MSKLNFDKFIVETQTGDPVLCRARLSAGQSASVGSVAAQVKDDIGGVSVQFVDPVLLCDTPEEAVQAFHNHAHEKAVQYTRWAQDANLGMLIEFNRRAQSE